MRISDWSSDVCSSDLRAAHHGERGRQHRMFFGRHQRNGRKRRHRWLAHRKDVRARADHVQKFDQIIDIVVEVEMALFRRHQLGVTPVGDVRSEEHTSELQSLMRISYAVFCLKKKKKNQYQYKYK